MTKTYWITDSRFRYIGLLLFLIWVGFMILFYLKADEITKDPCSICSERMGKNVFCTTQTAIPITRTYLPNGTVYDNSDEARKEVYRNQSKKFDDLNYSALLPND